MGNTSLEVLHAADLPAAASDLAIYSGQATAACM
jgi:hypothetical protein